MSRKKIVHKMRRRPINFSEFEGKIVDEERARKLMTSYISQFGSVDRLIDVLADEDRAKQKFTAEQIGYLFAASGYMTMRGRGESYHRIFNICSNYIQSGVFHDQDLRGISAGDPGSDLPAQ